MHQNGADELDMAINRSYGAKLWSSFCRNNCTKKICGEKYQVIIETSLLTEEEKISMCSFITCAHADFIKTSTGFSTGGATREDIELFTHHIGKGVRMKASGGISSLEDAQDYIGLGCDRIGTSAIVKIIKDMQ